MPEDPAAPPVVPAQVRARRAHLRDLDAPTFYRLAQLREEVFCLEQGATDADLDGRELEDGTVLVWLEAPDGAPVAQARVLTDPDALRIGRVVVRADARRDGLGRRIMAAALAVCRELDAEREVRIDAQAHLEAWYASMGFVAVGGVFLEAGIEHIAMVLAPAPRAGTQGTGGAVGLT